MQRVKHIGGFTLLELVVVITLSAIVVSFVALFIITPVRSYNAQARRAELVESADSVLRLMGRDVRAALPNSVRVVRTGNVWAIEMLAVVDGVRYRNTGSATNTAQELDFSTPDAQFSTLSKFENVARGVQLSYYLAIYNVGVPGADAYSLSNVITPASTRITIADNPADINEDLVTLTSPFKFAYPSPNKRVFLVSGPVTYLCDQTANTLRRYSGYTINGTQTNRDSAAELNAAGASSSLVANRVNSCQFDYVAGTATRAGLVTLRMSFNYINEGNTESIWLLHQVHVGNAP